MDTLKIPASYDERLCLKFLAAGMSWEIATLHFDGHIPDRIMSLQSRLESYRNIQNIHDRYSNIYRD